MEGASYFYTHAACSPLLPAVTPGLLFAFVWDPKGRHKPGCSERRLSVRLSCTFNSSTCTLTSLLPLPAAILLTEAFWALPLPWHPSAAPHFWLISFFPAWLPLGTEHFTSAHFFLAKQYRAGPGPGEGPSGRRARSLPHLPPQKKSLPPAGGGHQGKAQRHRAGLQPRVRAGDPAPRDAGVRLSVLPGKASGGGAWVHTSQASKWGLVTLSRPSHGGK